MKVGYQALIISLCLLTQRAAHASASDPEAQQNTANSTTATSNHSANHEQAALAAEPRNQEGVTAWRQSTRRQAVSRNIPLPRHATVANAQRLKPLHKDIQGHKLRSLVDGAQPNLIKPTGATKTVVNRKSPMQPAAGSGIDGGNFRNRHLQQTPGILGGPAKTAKNNATLSGTGMGRKGPN